MSKLVDIQIKYEEILNYYKEKYSFNGTITKNFEEFNNLFKSILKKEVNNQNVIIEKRDEYDLFKGILSQIGGNYHKSVANSLENKYKFLFNHRDRLVELLKNNKFKFPKKQVRDLLIIQKPDYGYHMKNPKFPLLEDNNDVF